MRDAVEVQFGCGVEFQRTQRLAERLLERPPDRHRLAHRLHLRVEARVGAGELLQLEARHLHHHVIERRLESGGGAAGDVVGDLVQAIAHGEQRGDFGDWVAGGLRRQRRRAADARVHLDDDHATVLRVHGKLDIGAARIHADRAQHGNRSVAHPLVLAIGERLRGCDGDRVARVDAHRVEVLNGADDNDVVRVVAHHLHLVLFPADDGFFEQHRGGGTFDERLVDNGREFLEVVGNPAARPAEREAGPRDERVAQFGGYVQRRAQAAHLFAARDFEADVEHRLLEERAIFGQLDRRGGRADQLDAMPFQRAVFRQRHRQIERRLPAERRQQRVRALLHDDRLDELRRQRLDIDRVRKLRVRHNRRRVGIDDHQLIPGLAQRLERLRAGIVEFGRLPDDDWAGAEDENFMNVGAFWHGFPL